MPGNKGHWSRCAAGTRATEAASRAGPGNRQPGCGAALQRRAERRGQSLQQFLMSELRRLAERPSIDEVLDRIDRRSGGQVGLRQAADDLGEERARR